MYTCMVQSYARDHRNFVNNVFVAKLEVYIINVEQEIDGSVRCSGDAFIPHVRGRTVLYLLTRHMVFSYPTHGYVQKQGVG